MWEFWQNLGQASETDRKNRQENLNPQEKPTGKTDMKKTDRKNRHEKSDSIQKPQENFSIF